ncbi:mechanosensitive ion channel [Defluviimonas sp. D31]|uniref:mechanosensitive ion channel family protein n=1 Tax=Defluviimonas sp. D31 TaxID=3083253 RepID=UPI00296E5F65|nr:mechanosensitive ion channel domain-containing protein [Defluviimonas sp. D31]MDW4550713.1 mechanosensitive ion channel [Defluviimonas sp. D31]
MQILAILRDLESLIDLSAVSAATRRDSGINTAMALLEVFERPDPLDVSRVPDEEAMSDGGARTYPIPSTPLVIRRIDGGSRDSEFLFAESSIQIAPRLLRGLRSDGIGDAARDWSHELRVFAGPWIPTDFITALPDSLKRDILGTPLWKALLATATCMIALAVLLFARRALPGELTEERLIDPVARLAYAAAILMTLISIAYLFRYQLNVTGTFAEFLYALLTIAWFGTLAAVFWNAAIAGFDAISRNPKREALEIDQSLMHLVGQIVGIVGAVWIVAYGAQTLGLPLLSLLAGLGVGGLAAALAIRPTLENLVGGLVLYLDRPVRVGDFCAFGSYMGTVERIGVRSTKVRALDRTLITVSNAQFATMELVNWAECDEMMIEQTIGLRYETDSDQLRYVLAELRRIAFAHPRIDNDSVRVRLVGFGTSSLDIEVRVYAKTTEWNDFYAIREDFFLRVKQVVEDAGTSFAFPSTTLYVSRDAGLDPDKTEAAAHAVDRWRQQLELPFPDFSGEKRKKIDDTIIYPPEGSPGTVTDEDNRNVRDEPLSKTPVAAANPEEDAGLSKDGPVKKSP